ncbi:unnamed protein product [Penicillium olsonii]|nr:unnamed protein product [Penicillium olsonii]
MPSRRSAAQVATSAGQGISETDDVPVIARHSDIAGPDTDPPYGPQGVNTQPALSLSPIAKNQKQKHWTVVHRKCLNLFKDADKEREEAERSIERLKAEIAQGAENIRQLSDERNQTVAKLQTLEKQISALKQQLEAAQSAGAAGDDGLLTLIHLGTNVNVLKTDIDKEVEARRNKRLAAGMPDSDVLQVNWPVHNGQMGMFDTNALPNYSLPSTFSLTNQQALAQVNQQPNPYQSPF